MHPSVRATVFGKRRTLSSAKRVLFIGDSQMAGRGTGGGSVNMDGARALAIPTKTRDALITAGYPASSESFSQANNTGGTLDLYDPRVVMNSWSVTGAGLGLCGLLLTKTAGDGSTSLRFTPSSPVDTFEVWTPRNTYGTMGVNIDGGSSTTIDENGASTFLKTTFTTTLGTHELRVGGSAITGTVYLNTVVAYNSAAKDFRLINMGTRNWSTTDWIVADQPWRPLTGIPFMVGSGDIAIIMLGVNDFRTGGPLNSLATFKANMQTIITKCVTAGASVGLVLPMPVDTAREGSFTQAEMLTAYRELAAMNACPFLNTNSYLGTWADGNAASQTTDDLHWKAAASATMGAPVAAMIRGLAGVA